ncbi:MAG TPA: EAL domain-containing protein, partial [Allosphingosinicella sp.]
MATAGTISGFRSRAKLYAAAAVAPWPLSWLAAASDVPPAAVILACLTASLLALAALVRLLRPLEKIVERLKAYAAAEQPDMTGLPDDELELILQCVDQLTERVRSLQHRWVWRHPLTNLPIRESLAQAIGEDLVRGAGPTLVGALRFVDYNRLAVFDPAVADAALKRFVDRLSSSLGPLRPVAHVDRDSFAIWFRGSDVETAIVEMQALCYTLGAELIAGTMKVIPEIEVGTALYPTDGEEPAALINHALASLARPGATGVAELAPGQSAHVARERFALEQDLHHAIERGQFDMAFQPVVDLSEGRLIGAEALLRWRHPEEGMVSPARFIPILEDADLIDEIGRWTLNFACKEMRRWQKRGLDDLKVAVNLSANQLRDTGLLPMVQRTL